MQSLLHNFGVDWKLLLAQVVNFFILLFILKRYAYAPIVHMLRDRQLRIQKGLEDSAEAERKLKSAAQKEEEIIESAEEKGLEIVSRAEDAASKKEIELLEAAHGKVESVIASAQKHIQEEREKIADEFNREAEELVALATAKVLGGMEPDKRDRILIQEALIELSAAAKKI
jgi:F-type H+-transporting ATPase subunit b